MLTPEEIEAIRREEMERLGAEEAARDDRPFPQGSTPRMEDKEGDRLTKEREARAVRKAIEEEFWLARGYKKYTTRHGKELWLTPDEIKERKSRRRSKQRSKAAPTQGFFETDGVKRVLLYLAVLALGVFLGLQLVR